MPLPFRSGIKSRPVEPCRGVTLACTQPQLEALEALLSADIAPDSFATATVIHGYTPYASSTE